MDSLGKQGRKHVQDHGTETDDVYHHHDHEHAMVRKD